MTNISCQSCRDVYVWPVAAKGSMVDGARAKGWIVWEGATVGGDQVKRTFCPVCRGVAEPPAEPEPTWDAVCKTCDASMSEEWGPEHDGPFTEKDAKEWQSDHRCEKWVDLIAPKPRKQAEPVRGQLQVAS